MAAERVTVTLPADVVQDIDRRERNRSKFVLEAVQRELRRRQREELRRSLRSPHPESSETDELGIDDWACRLPAQDDDLLDVSAGKKVRWAPDIGWIEGEE